MSALNLEPAGWADAGLDRAGQWERRRRQSGSRRRGPSGPGDWAGSLTETVDRYGGSSTLIANPLVLNDSGE